MYKEVLDQYKQTQVATADRGQLVVMLYEGAIKFIDQAIAKMHHATYDQVNASCQRVQDILDELRVSLDMKAGGEIATRLDSIYEYLGRRVREANFEKKAEPLLEVRGLLNDLLGAWKEVVRKGAAGPSAKADPRGGFSIQG